MSDKIEAYMKRWGLIAGAVVALLALGQQWAVSQENQKAMAKQLDAIEIKREHTSLEAAAIRERLTRIERDVEWIRRALERKEK